MHTCYIWRSLANSRRIHDDDDDPSKYWETELSVFPRPLLNPLLGATWNLFTNSALSPDLHSMGYNKRGLSLLTFEPRAPNSPERETDLNPCELSHTWSWWKRACWYIEFFNFAKLHFPARLMNPELKVVRSNLTCINHVRYRVCEVRYPTSWSRGIIFWAREVFSLAKWLSRIALGITRLRNNQQMHPWGRRIFTIVRRKASGRITRSALIRNPGNKPHWAFSTFNTFRLLVLDFKYLVLGKWTDKTSGWAGAFKIHLPF